MMTVWVNPLLLPDFVNDFKKPIPLLRLCLIYHGYLDLRDTTFVKLAFCLSYIWQLASDFHFLTLGDALRHADLVSLDLEDLLD
jgi:hypothetical protein